MDKEEVVYVYNRYYSDIKKNEIMPFGTTWMDPDCITLREKSQRKANTVFSFICRM